MGLFAGCSNDTLTGDDSDGELNGSKDAVDMNVSVQLPAGGGIARSETNTPDNGDCSCWQQQMTNLSLIVSWRKRITP